MAMPAILTRFVRVSRCALACAAAPLFAPPPRLTLLRWLDADALTAPVLSFALAGVLAGRIFCEAACIRPEPVFAFSAPARILPEGMRELFVFERMLMLPEREALSLERASFVFGRALLEAGRIVPEPLLLLVRERATSTSAWLPRATVLLLGFALE